MMKLKDVPLETTEITCGDVEGRSSFENSDDVEERTSGDNSDDVEGRSFGDTNDDIEKRSFGDKIMMLKDARRR